MTETTLHAETLRLLTVRFGYSERRAKDIINIPENWRVTAAKGQWQARAEAAEATVSRLTAENEKMREALKPFAEFGRRNVDEDGWKSNIHREGISVWFGPSEFRAAWVASKSLGGKDE